MTVSQKRRELILTAAVCLAVAAALLLLCSQSSPLYPINLWDDANCLLTVGRVMRAGGVLYRDIYEQKGPTLYLLHLFAACISDTSFFGVYVMEVLSLAAALLFSCRLLRLRFSLPASLAGASLAYALLLTSASFARGDSAEEFCLPLLAAALCIAFSEYDRKAGPMRLSRLMLCGLAAGLVATIKYTVLGLFVGLCLCEGMLALRTGGLRRALISAGAFLLGMAAPIALWCAYFAANGALADFATAYLYNNIFLYDAGAGAGDTLTQLLRIARDNALWIIPTGAGVLCFALFSQENGALRATAFAASACAAIAALLIGRLWPYCALALGALTPVGLLGLREMAHRLGLIPVKTDTEHGAALDGAADKPGAHCSGGLDDSKNLPAAHFFGASRILCAACLALSIAIACFASPNAFLRGVPLANLAQGRLSELIPPGATLLQYSHLDDGLYLTSGALPREKFFVLLNVRYQAMLDALDHYLACGEPDYVLISWRELPEEFDLYELVAQDTAYDDANRLNKALYLYRKKGL